MFVCGFSVVAHGLLFICCGGSVRCLGCFMVEFGFAGFGCGFCVCVGWRVDVILFGVVLMLCFIAGTDCLLKLVLG